MSNSGSHSAQIIHQTNVYSIDILFHIFKKLTQAELSYLLLAKQGKIDAKVFPGGAKPPFFLGNVIIKIRQKFQEALEATLVYYTYLLIW